VVLVRFFTASGLGEAYTRPKLTDMSSKASHSGVWSSSNSRSLGDSGVLDANTVLYLVWRYVGRCTNAVRMGLMVFVAVLIVVPVSMGLPWVA